jgi:hypothetical protein
MGITSRICTIPVDLVCPITTKLGTAITALKVASMVKINLYITWHLIFITSTTDHPVKVFCCPWLPTTVVPVA